MKNEPIAETSRREFVKKLVYIAPAVVTLSVAPSFAKAGSIHCAPPTAVSPPRPSVCGP